MSPNYRESRGNSEPSGRSAREPMPELEARVRALNCLYGISGLVERAEGDLGEILQGTVDLLPHTWEHGEHACARVELEGQQYTSDGFEESSWSQSADLRVNGACVGTVEVLFPGYTPQVGHEILFDSERALLQAVAERLGHVVERIRAQELLRKRDLELRDDLAHLTRVVVMGEMASMIAHEVNQPLTAIANYAHACQRLLESGEMDEGETKETLSRIANEAIRAGAIIHGMKDLSRKRQTKHKVHDINAIVLEIQPLVKVDARARSVRLRLDLGESLPPVIVDRVQVQQVIINLVRNAIDAMEDTPADDREVVINTQSTDAGDVEVSVADSGCGIPEDESERIYDTFYTTKDGGMGMGLSVSKTIVESHGGQLVCSENPNGGTVFRFAFPPAAGNENESG